MLATTGLFSDNSRLRSIDIKVSANKLQAESESISSSFPSINYGVAISLLTAQATAATDTKMATQRQPELAKGRSTA